MSRPRDAPTDSLGDASRRTWLAGERTFLAWTRNGLGALAVAIAMGRIVPELGPTDYRWLYTVAGVSYAVLGMGFIVYGFHRQRSLGQLITEGGFQSLPPLVIGVIAAYGVALGLLTIALLLLPL
jgi:putative membrane protein